MENTIKIIETIGRQWHFVLVVFFIVIFIIKWKTIWAFAASITQIKVKRGNTEVEVNTDSNEEKEETPSKIADPKIPSKEEVSEYSEEKKEEEADLESNYYAELTERNYNKARDLFEKILDEENDPIERNKRKIGNYYLRYASGDTSAFSELEKYIGGVDDAENKSYALYYLAHFYSDGNNHEKAEELLKEALNLTIVESQKARVISKMADVYYESGNEETSLEILLKNLSKITEREPLISIYGSIAVYYKKKDNKLLQSVALQKALELNPNDTTTIFNTAYNFSQIDSEFTDLGLMLYKKLIRFNPNDKTALNNLGVSCSNLDLKVKSVNYYKKSFEKGESLAASNLAYLLINDGFEKEAEDYLEKVKELKEVNDNVYSAASHLKSKIKSESESEEKIIERATKKYIFLNAFGKSAFSNTLTSIDQTKKWSINENAVKIEIQDEEIGFEWDDKDEKHKITGTTTNNSFILDYRKPKRNIYSYSDDTKYTFSNHKGYGYIENKHSIKCFFEIEKELNEITFIVK